MSAILQATNINKIYDEGAVSTQVSVSYTHLTLPTKRIV